MRSYMWSGFRLNLQIFNSAYFYHPFKERRSRVGGQFLAAVIPSRERKKIEKIQKDLRSLSLLEEDESIREGFYPIRIGRFFYYGFLTPRQLILEVKRPYGGNIKRSELIPFNNIKEVSMKHERSRQLLFNLILISVLFPILLFIIYWVDSFMNNFDNPEPFNFFFDIIFWVYLIIFPLVIAQSLYRFVKGEPIIILMSSAGLPLKVQSKYGLFLRLSPLYFFTLTGTEVNFEGTKGGFEELYQHLQTYSKI
jgi:hypothetical protein